MGHNYSAPDHVLRAPTALDEVNRQEIPAAVGFEVMTGLCAIAVQRTAANGNSWVPCVLSQRQRECSLQILSSALWVL
jgi:hypothetical protein